MKSQSVYGRDTFSPAHLARRETARLERVAAREVAQQQRESVGNTLAPRMVHSPDPGLIWRRANLDEQFIEQNQDPERNSALTSVVNWEIMTFLTAPMVVAEVVDEDQFEFLPEHPGSRVVDRPNPEHSWAEVMDFSLRDLFMDEKGSAFLLKSRESRWMQMVALWPLAAQQIEPKGNRRQLITHYEYTVGGEKIDIPRSEMIHLRLGISKVNMRLGRDPLMAIRRDLFGDDEAARYQSSLVYNAAVPGTVLSPKNEFAPPLATDEKSAEQVKERFRESFSGAGRGGVMLGESAMDVSTVSLSPREMNFRDLRKLPEERISGNHNVPAIVAGLGAGLDRSTFSNYAEAREAGYEEAVIYLQNTLARQFTYQLLRQEFTDDEAFVYKFDLRNVRILQEDRNEKHKRIRDDLLSGRITLGEAYKLAGDDDSGLSEEEKGVRYIPTSVRVVKPGELLTVDDMPEAPPDQFDGAPSGDDSGAGGDNRDAPGDGGQSGDDGDAPGDGGQSGDDGGGDE